MNKHLTQSYYNSSSNYDNPKQTGENTNGAQSDINQNEFYQLRNKPKYKINPDLIPRPSEYTDTFINESNSSEIFETNSELHLPHAASNYIVKETNNSSCRFIRPTLSKIPFYQSILNNSNLIFGLYCQPFAEVQKDEDEIKKTDASKGILRCKSCYSYINSKYNIMNKSGGDIAICNLCKTENKTSNYDNSDIYSNLTYDFIPPEHLIKNKTPFTPHYIIIIDISYQSFQIGFPEYVLNSFQNNFTLFNNSENSYITFACYDSNGLYYFTLDKNNDISITIMNDILNPFCPIYINKLFLNISKEREMLSILIEKINNFIEYHRNKSKNEPKVNITLSAIISGIQSLDTNGGRVMIFSASKTKELIDITSTEKSPIETAIETANNNRVVIDQFIFQNSQYPLREISRLSSETGGDIKYYELNDEYNDISILFEKLHYDISRIVTRNNYYNIIVKLRCSMGIEVINLYGGVNKKYSPSFYLSGMDPDSSFMYELKVSDTLYENDSIDFQLACSYINNNSENYIRVFNYSIYPTKQVNQIFSYCDIDSLTKIVLMKGISSIGTLSNGDIQSNLISQIVNMFYYYKKNTKQGNSPQLILPAQVKYLPVYINSILKKDCFPLEQIKTFSTYTIYMNHKLLKGALYDTMLCLYPFLYRIDFNNITQLETKVKLSLDAIAINKPYFYTNGQIAEIFIFDTTEVIYFKKLFGFSNFEECIQNEVNGLSEMEENDEMGNYVKGWIEEKRKENFGNYLPLKINFIYKHEALQNKRFILKLVEDEYKGKSSYPDFLFYLHGLIEKKFV